MFLLLYIFLCVSTKYCSSFKPHSPTALGSRCRWAHQEAVTCHYFTPRASLTFCAILPHSRLKRRPLPLLLSFRNAVNLSFSIFFLILFYFVDISCKFMREGERARESAIYCKSFQHPQWPQKPHSALMAHGWSIPWFPRPEGNSALNHSKHRLGSRCCFRLGQVSRRANQKPHSETFGIL